MYRYDVSIEGNSIIVEARDKEYYSGIYNKYTGATILSILNNPSLFFDNNEGYKVVQRENKHIVIDIDENRQGDLERYFEVKGYSNEKQLLLLKYGLWSVMVSEGKYAENSNGDVLIDLLQGLNDVYLMSFYMRKDVINAIEHKDTPNIQRLEELLISMYYRVIDSEEFEQLLFENLKEYLMNIDKQIVNAEMVNSTDYLVLRRLILMPMLYLNETKRDEYLKKLGDYYIEYVFEQKMSMVKLLTDVLGR